MQTTERGTEVSKLVIAKAETTSLPNFEPMRRTSWEAARMAITPKITNEYLGDEETNRHLVCESPFVSFSLLARY